ncbi:hypothetical protein ACFQH6_12155 [Halobacteriaceae archaeon GCM10025711]
MSTHVDSEPRIDARDGRHAPAYGPIDAVLGFLLFYYVVDRATPTVVAVFADVLPDVSPSLVGLGLAMLLWFILVVTAVDQVRRQLAALGVGTHHAVDSDTESSATYPAQQALGYGVLVVLGGAVAAWTFDRGVETAVSMIRVVATLDAGAFVLADFVVMVVFFASFGLATHSLDRLVIGGVRSMLAD